MGPPDGKVAFKRHHVGLQQDYAFGQESASVKVGSKVSPKVSPLAKKTGNFSKFSEFSEVSAEISEFSAKFSEFPNFSNFASQSGLSTGRGGRFENQVEELERETLKSQIFPPFFSFNDRENLNPQKNWNSQENWNFQKNLNFQRRGLSPLKNGSNSHEKLFLYQARQQQNQQTNSRFQQNSQVQVPTVQLAPPQGSDNQSKKSSGGGSWSQMLKK